LKFKLKSCDFQLKITEPIQEDGEEHKVNPKIKIYYSNQHNHEDEQEQDPNPDEDQSMNYISFVWILLEEKARFDVHPSVKVQTDELIRLGLSNNQIIALPEEKKNF